MPSYEVCWRIDIEADSPLEAARIARECQAPDTEALAFDVCEPDGTLIEIIDLLEHQEEETNATT